MRPEGGGVQFFDLVEVDWKSDRGNVASVGASSGCTVDATGATCTVGMAAGARAVGGQRGAHVGSTGPARRDGRIIGMASALAGRASGPIAWGIMVPES
jgi:hypothetical protein